MLHRLTIALGILLAGAAVTARGTTVRTVDDKTTSGTIKGFDHGQLLLQTQSKTPLWSSCRLRKSSKSRFGRWRGRSWPRRRGPLGARRIRFGARSAICSGAPRRPLRPSRPHRSRQISRLPTIPRPPTIRPPPRRLRRRRQSRPNSPLANLARRQQRLRYAQPRASRFPARLAPAAARNRRFMPAGLAGKSSLSAAITFGPN